MVRLLTNRKSRHPRVGKILTGLCLAFLLTFNGKAVAQSASFGSSYAYGGGITSIIGQHDFQTGSGSLSLGIIGSERATNSAYGFLQGASWLNAADDAFIDGYATTYGTGAFTFPIGDNGKYRPAAVSTAATALPASAAYYGVDPTTAITTALQGGNEVALPTGAPFAITAKGTGISTVTNKEYWDIKGATAAKISLTWDATSAISTLTSSTLAKLTIVGWNGTQWVRIPSTVDATSIIGGASSLTAGSITTNAAITPNTYTVYSFAAFAATFTFNCGTATSTGTFVANGTGSQTGNLTIPITGVTAGAATFTVAGAGFTGTLSTTLTGSETSVVIPITYDGTGAARSETLTITSTEGTGTCTKAVTVVAQVATFTFNCGSATSTGTFTATGTGGQTGTLVIPMTGATAGGATFTVTGTGFTGTLTTTLTAGQTDVTIPITYDGTGAARSESLIVTSAQGTGTCTKAVTVAAQVATFTFNCGTATSTGTFTATGTGGQAGTLVIPMTGATAGGATFTVTGTGFTGTLTTTLTAGQTDVTIPITYDGTGAAGSRTLTVTSSQGTGTCTPSVSVGSSCAVATVGGTVAYSGGTLCDASNIGTAMLTGNTGNIVRWETSTNGGGAWTPITNMNTYHNFANAANGQQYRAVVNNGAGCLDANSAVATIATSAAACTSASCDNTTGNITFTTPTTPTLSGFDSKIIMTNASGVIQYASANNALTISGVAVGDYLVYRVVYDPTQLPIPTLTVGTNITAIGGTCVKFTNQLAYKVCAAAAPDLTTTIGQPSPTLQVGVTSDLPITVANIGTGPAPGIITTTITLPPGVTAPPTFTSNGWTCSTTAPSVTCTNPGPIAAGANNIFNVPITPDASIVGTNPIFNANTNPVTGETVTGNNAAPPTAVTSPVLPGAPDLVTTIGQPSPALSVGQPSNLPIKVANIGTASAPGVITTTITLPAGITAPPTFTSNSWTCSTTAPTVTCTNAGPLAAGRDSTFLVPITPDASLSGTNPIFNARTNPVTGETITNNNAAPPTMILTPVIGGSLLTMKVLLQGNYDPNTGWMHDSLRKKGLIPLSDPYRTVAYSSLFLHKKNAATQTTTNAILAVTGANAIVDWVFIELHSASNPAMVIATKSALVQRDGDIVSAADGVSPVYVDSIASGNYYIAIRHRNHLGTMTAATRSLSATSTVVDFTALTAAQLWNKAGGDGYEQTKAGIRNLLWAGDTDGNRQTVFAGPTNDVDPVFFDVMTNVNNVANMVPNYIVNSAYLASDVNLDGKVIFQSADNELDIILFMTLSHTLNVGFIPSYIIAEQLP